MFTFISIIISHLHYQPNSLPAITLPIYQNQHQFAFKTISTIKTLSKNKTKNLPLKTKIYARI